MFLLNAPAQRLATALKRGLTAGFFEVACAGKGCTAKFRVPKGEKLSEHSSFTCTECNKGRSSLGKGYFEQPDGTFVHKDDDEASRREKGKERSRQWRKDHREEAAEYKRRYRARVSYVESRKELTADADWEAELKEFGYKCSTPDCGQTLTLRTALRWPEGPTYVPVCSRCRGKKAAQERSRKEKSWKSNT
jgi:hypothetical protein